MDITVCKKEEWYVVAHQTKKRKNYEEYTQSH